MLSVGMNRFSHSLPLLFHVFAILKLQFNELGEVIKVILESDPAQSATIFR